MVHTLGGCGGLEKNSFLTIPTLGSGVVVLKELIFNNFYFERAVVVFKELTLMLSYFGSDVVVLKKLNFNNFYFETVGGGLERTDF